MKENQQSSFAVLNKINCNEHTEKKNGLTYLSWAWAWQIVKTHYPNAQYIIYENEQGIPYFTDGKTCWVKTGVIIDGLEHIEYLPIMDFRNQSIPLERVTSMDMNKAIQRSLTKACARHGLGLYIYASEDLPTEDPDTEKTCTPTEKKSPRKSQKKAQYQPLDEKVYTRMIECYARGIPSKSGSDYKTAWIEATNAGPGEIAMWDDAVFDYKINNNLI